MNEKPSIKSSGFSLIELSVVILIVGILIYMTLAAGRQQLEIARITHTRYKLEKIQTALALYLKTYGHLPCPGDGSLAINDPNFGLQLGYANPAGSINGDATCDKVTLLTDYLIPNLYVGVVPIRELGMSDNSLLDGWDDRITYIVSSSCVDPDDWNATFKYKCGFYNNVTSVFDSTKDGSKIILHDKNDNEYPVKAAYLLISHGASGYGAWPSQGGSKKTINGSIGVAASTGEYYNGNLDSSGNPNFGVSARTTYFDQNINDGDVMPNYFDNITAWASAAQLYYNSNH